MGAPIWKKISWKSATEYVSKAAAFLQGGTAAAAQPPPQTTVITSPASPGIPNSFPVSTTTLLLIGAGVVALIIFTRRH